MTIAIYEMQAASASWSALAQEAVTRSEGVSLSEVVGYAVLARLVSIGALARSLLNGTFALPHRITKLLVIPLQDPSLNGLARMGIATALVVSLTALRFFISLAGILSPEITFGVLKAHRFLLRLGLICRSQYGFVRGLPSPLNILLSGVNGQQWRRHVVDSVLRRIDEREMNGTALRPGFSSNIWLPSELEALGNELEMIIEAFERPVVVRHSVLEAFQERLLSGLHAEALELHRQGLYEKDEVEDMATAFAAVMHRAIAKAVDDCFVVIENKLSLGSATVAFTELQVNGGGQKIILKDAVLEDGRAVMVQEERLVDGQSLCLLVPSVPFGKICSNEKKILSGKDVFFTHDLTLINGQKVLGQEAGGLEKWKASLIEMKLLINGMSSEEKALLPYYLCADMERVQKIRPDLHNISEYPVIERCFRLIVELYTVFVARHMPPNTRALQEAFTLL